MAEANENQEQAAPNLADHEIGEGLKGYRMVKKDWSQREVSRQSGCSQSAISNAERGVFSSETLEALLELYELDMNELAEWTRSYLALKSA